ncbi:MAG TPA: EAL domain-containing protein, partial [Acidimicrobiia bacterium]
VLLEAVERIVDGSSCSVRLCNPESGRLLSVAAPTLPVDFVRSIDELLSLDHAPERFGTEDVLVFPDIHEAEMAPDIRQVALLHGLRALTSMPIRNPDGSQVIGLLALFLRVPRPPTATEIALLERTRDLVALVIDHAAHTEQLGYLALHDTLTGLPNRSLAVDRLEQALKRLGEHDAMVAVLFIDLDRFKMVNDDLGHDTGDELLVAASRRLVAELRQQDTVARFGGDEFVVLCEDLVNERQAEELAGRAAAALAKPFGLGRAEVMVSASVGIAVTRAATLGAADLLRNADAAMYRAKRRGGSGYEVFDDDMQSQAATRKLTEGALHQALDRDELRVLYQPQFDLRTGEQVASEALLRWSHPVRGTVAPADFLRVAEETGAIVPIGEWVLEQACAHARRSLTAGPQHSPLCVSANLSARQLLRPDFPRTVASTLQRHGIAPETLCLEIAEATLLDDIDATHVALRALKEHGVRLAIDDFGTGGSSLTYLRQFPFDELKVDDSFIVGLGKTPTDDAIVGATIDMAHALDLVVAAEGVESEEQLVRLTELGCDRAQGFHLGRPDSPPLDELVLDEMALVGPSRGRPADLSAN